MEWHTAGLKALFSTLGSSESGIGSAEAEKRLQRYGRNSVAIKKRISPLLLFLNQFRSLLVMLLLLAALLSLAISFLKPGQADFIDAQKR